MKIQEEPIVISLGGSLVVPNGSIDSTYLAHFSAFIRKQIAAGRRFFIVIGGGAIARLYIDAARKVIGEVTNWDLDWLGIHATRLNAHLVRTIFRDVAHPRIIQNYNKKVTHLKEPVVIAAGWKPGCSTDFDAVILAHDYRAHLLINMSNITSVYDKDPSIYKDACPIHTLTWEEYEKLIPATWVPGSNTPFDPIATKLAKELKLKVYITGKDLDNLEKIINGTEFIGTAISP